MSEPQTALRQKRLAYQKALAAALDDIVARLAARGAVERAILFGSYARGREDLFTDLDLLIIMESEEPFVIRTARMYAYLAPRVDVDLLVYTPDEFTKQQDSRFWRRALQEGTVIYEKQRS
jgi:predicted nucleotidyltransferase